MDYFPGESLQKHLDANGPLSVDDLCAIGEQVIAAMLAAHGKSILHRDLKPDNVLVRRQDGRWEVKVIDFGLALRTRTVQQSLAQTNGRSVLGSSAAGTLKYAPPEQMDELPGIQPGPYSDVYSFGKLCCFALFGRTEPRTRQLKQVSESLAELLEECIEHLPQDRPADFAEVQERFGQSAQKSSPPSSTPATPFAVAKPAPPKETPPPPPFFAGSRAGEERADNSLKTPFCWCPPGRFLMGSPQDGAERGADEDQVEVTLSRGFWLAKYPVTQAEYEQVMGTNPSYFSPSDGGKGRVTGLDTSRFPVEQVSWEDAVEFCRKLTDLERQAGRLPPDWEYCVPTEAQWEYACRAGATGPFGIGDGKSLSSKLANFDGNYPYGGAEKGKYLQRTSAVGEYPANRWGLHDMHGNVYEWCQDWYQERLPGGTDPCVLDASVTANRVYRGGCWYGPGWRCRSARRDWHEPGNRVSLLGFRLARSQSI
jgi:formylglycine-generating enzyme required for sulfatase activity